MDCQLYSTPTDMNLGQLIRNTPLENREEMLEDYIKTNYTDYRILYTDASKKSDEHGSKVGAAFTHPGCMKDFKFKLRSNVSVAEAEAFAIYKAIRYAWQEEYPNTLIITDSKSVLDKLGAVSYSTGAYSIILDIKLKIELQEKRGRRIIIAWVPRLSVQGNRKADLLAKDSWQSGTFDSFEPNYNAAIKDIEINYYKNWHLAASNLLEQDKRKNYISNSSFSMPDIDYKRIRNLSRKNSIRLSRLLSGYVADIEFMFKIKKRDSKECICGSPNGNFLHIFRDCNQFLISRFQLQDSLLNLGYNSVITIQEILVKRDMTALSEIFKFLDGINYHI